MASNINQYKLETLSGQPIDSIKGEILESNINKNIITDIDSDIKSLENSFSNENENLNLIQIAFFILVVFICVGLLIWVLKLLGKLPEEIEKIINYLFKTLQNFFKLFLPNSQNKDSNNSPIVSLEAPPTEYKTVKNSEINDGKDVPDETQDNEGSLPVPGSQTRVVSNAQTWVEGNDPREVTKSQISVPPTPLPQQGNPEPVDTLDNSDSKKNAGYCFIGEDRGFRSCIYVNDYNKCLSGQVFPNEALCINPNFR